MLLEAGVGRGQLRCVALKGHHTGSLCRREGPVSPFHLCDILVGILWSSFARCYHRGKPGKGYVGSFCYKCIWINNDLKTKSLIKKRALKYMYAKSLEENVSELQ